MKEEANWVPAFYRADIKGWVDENEYGRHSERCFFRTDQEIPVKKLEEWDIWVAIGFEENEGAGVGDILSVQQNFISLI